MSESYYKVLRSRSLESLHKLLSDAESQGWHSIGNIDLLNGEYAQPIKFSHFDDDPTEIITVKNYEIDE